MNEKPPWFIPFEERPDARDVVFAFPNAGGGCSSLKIMAREVDKAIDFRTVNLPGRQARFLEPPRTDLVGLVDEVAASIAEESPVRYSLFGYCFGALLAYLVACRLKECGVPGPRLLCVASLDAPGVMEPLDDLVALPDSRFWGAIARLGGIPEDVANDEFMREIAEPPLRADFQLLAGYRQDAPDVLDTPLVVLEGAMDEWGDESSAMAWASLTTAPCKVMTLDTGHWIVDEAPREVAALLSEALRNSSP